MVVPPSSGATGLGDRSPHGRPLLFRDHDVPRAWGHPHRGRFSRTNSSHTRYFALFKRRDKPKGPAVLQRKGFPAQLMREDGIGAGEVLVGNV